jgi:acyl carrier protein
MRLRRGGAIECERSRGTGMDESAIRDGVTATFRAIFGDDALSLAPDMTAADIAGWDSLRMVLILAALEERFGLRFTTRDMDSLKSVGDIVHVVGRRLSGT